MSHRKARNLVPAFTLCSRRIPAQHQYNRVKDSMAIITSSSNSNNNSSRKISKVSKPPTRCIKTLATTINIATTIPTRPQRCSLAITQAVAPCSHQITAANTQVITSTMGATSRTSSLNSSRSNSNHQQIQMRQQNLLNLLHTSMVPTVIMGIQAHTTRLMVTGIELPLYIFIHV